MRPELFSLGFFNMHSTAPNRPRFVGLPGKKGCSVGGKRKKVVEKKVVMTGG